MRKPFIFPTETAKWVTINAEDITVDVHEHDGEAPIRVVVADDHGMVRDSIRMACEQRDGLELVGEAADGNEALRQILLLKPADSLIDVLMPRPVGYVDVRHV